MSLLIDLHPFLLSQVVQEDSLRLSETFLAISSYQSNLYVGTSNGQLLHYHQFDDSPGYLLISQQELRKSPITHILVVKKSNKVVALCGGTMHLFSLPELSPLQSGKLKDVEDILLIDSDVLVATKDKIRRVRFSGPDVKLVMSISDVSAKKVLGIKSTSSLIIAGKSSYEIYADSKRVPLFEYDVEEKEVPFMVSYFAEDVRKEEILLVIKSDSNTSIGMFISAEGEPTRGTLTWVDRGYPSGVVVNWPYVFSIFKDQIVVSSLVDLDVKSEFAAQGILTQTLIKQEDENYSINGLSLHYIKSSVSLIGSNSVSILYQQLRVILFLEDLIKCIKGDIESIVLLDNERDPLYNELLFLYLVFKGDFGKLQLFTSSLFENIIVYLYMGGDYQFYKATSIVMEILRPNLGDNFREFALSQIRLFYLGNPSPALRVASYSDFKTSEEFISFSNKDKELWKKDNNWDPIITDLESKGLFTAVLYLYTLLHNSTQICLIATKFLIGEYEDSQKFDMVELIIENLDKVDDVKVYRDALLEVLRTDSKKGITYIKKNINGKYRSTHQDILNLSKGLDSDDDMKQLKLELLELGLKEGTASEQEILDHLIDILSQPSEVDINNISILYQTYLIENRFDGYKEITSWVEFLQAIKDTTECSKFIELYLKAFELLNYLGGAASLDSLVENPVFEFYKCCFVSEDKVAALLSYKDYTSAEFCSIYNKPPYPPHRYYITEDLIPTENYKQGILNVYESYKASEDIAAIKHFINTYGSIFSPGEVIDMLPSTFSVAYAEEYLTELFIRLEEQHRHTTMQKILSRQEVKTTKSLYTDLN